ncbi:MAG: AbgT family transporter [Acidobacteria bacterium]|nr:MAG: AbgT family transporter [Acidobacteriota bacterium]REK04444.1 MAG: AbgT family transporter [Acidobacteriota bacterium]
MSSKDRDHDDTRGTSAAKGAAGSQAPAETGEDGDGPAPQRASTAPQSRKGVFTRFLDFVEWLGNLLPHPVTLFALICVAVLLVSGLAGLLGWQVQDPRPPGAAGRSADGVIRAVSLLNAEGFRRIAMGVVTNFTGFAPLGTVLVAMLGVGVAERSGLLGAAVRAMVLGAPRNLLTMVVVFAAVVSNTASEMGYVVLIPLAAVVFHSVGRHPLAGLAAAFAGVSGGYSANLLIGTVDPLLSGITTEAAAIIDPAYAVGGAREVLPTANWFFMMISTVMITIVGTLVTTKIVEPKLGTYDPGNAEEGIEESTRGMGEMSALERKGLLWAGITVLALVAGLIFTAMPGGWFRDPEVDGALLQEIRPLLRSVVSLIFVFFVVPGVVYGRITRSIRSDRDVIDGMAKSMSTLGLYMVLVFFAAQFVAFFRWTNLGTILAVTGADLLRDWNLTGPLVFIPFILMCCFVNLMLGSASAQWAVTAPIFVPMLMTIGYSPQVIQAAYRIGDSTTNIITPMMSYFGLILAFAIRYDKKLGIGTLIATMIPYSICYLAGWVVLFYGWVFVLDLPVGPGTPTFYP